MALKLCIYPKTITLNWALQTSTEHSPEKKYFSRFLKVARLLQNLIGNGNEFRKTGVA